MTIGRLGLISLALFVTYSPAAPAQDADHDSGGTESNSSENASHDAHKNVLSVFVGVTHEGRRDNGAALGIGYERILNESFAVGVLAEHTFGDADLWVYAVPFSYRIDRWKFYIAPGIEESEKHGTESLVRISAEYAFDAGAWEVSPQVAIDFVDGDEVFVLGVVFGKGF